MQQFRITDERTLKGLRFMLPYVEGINAWNQYFHLFLYPHTCLSSVGGFTYSLQEYFPTESGTTLVTRLYLPRIRPSAPDLAFYFDSAAAKFNRQVLEEDAAMCAKVHLRCVGQQMRPPLKRLEWFAQARNDDRIAG